MVITFNFLTPISLPHRKALKDFISLMIENEKRKLSYLNVIFCSDTYLLEINNSYLSHNYFTDIITFNYAQPGSSTIEGDIYISVDTVRDNAKRFNSTITNEVHRVIFHGILHLIGFDDKNETQQAVMTKKENKYLDMYFPSPSTKF